jgi:hypothetical protein
MHVAGVSKEHSELSSARLSFELGVLPRLFSADRSFASKKLGDSDCITAQYSYIL